MRNILAAVTLLLLCAAPEAIKQRTAPKHAKPPRCRRSIATCFPILLQGHCQVCHREGEIGPMPLVTYDQTRPFARAIASSASQRKMPPWLAEPDIGRFANDPSLMAQEIATLVSWSDANAPAGDPHKAPAPRQWAQGWMIPQPDDVVQMPKPVAIPAHGDVEYTLGDRAHRIHRGQVGAALRSASFKPPERASRGGLCAASRVALVAQHAPIGVPFTGADMTDEQDRTDTHFTTADILLVYAPGSSPDNWTTGMAKFIPAGSDLVFQMHYMAHGHPMNDQTEHGPGLRQATSHAARAYAAADERRLRHSARRPRRTPASRYTVRCRTTRCCSASSRTCT